MSNPGEQADEVFRRRFLFYILLTWVLPPLCGFFLLQFMGLFTFQQLSGVARGSAFPLFALATLLFALWYFNRFSRPWWAFLTNPDRYNTELALRQLYRFGRHYWGLFALTMVVRPSFILHYTESQLGISASATDWLRIHMVLLVVFILVGVPLYLRIHDLLGEALGRLQLSHPRLSIRTKIFLIGSLVPLLIDTILVLYYWSRTGYFSAEMGLLWLLLEVVAVAGTLLFVRSIGQSLGPLQSLIRHPYIPRGLELDSLRGASTDELGILANEYRRLLLHHQQLTDRLRGSEQELQQILTNLQDTFYRTNLAGELIYLTPQVEQVLGYQVDDLLGTRVSRLYVDPRRHDDLMVQLQQHGEVSNFVNPLYHQNGTIVWGAANLRLYHDNSGEVAGVEGVMRDITPLKRAEQALELEQQRLLATLASIADAVITTDPAGRIDYLNPVAERLFAAQGEAIGKYYASVVPLYEECSGEKLDDLVELTLKHNANLVNASHGVWRRADGGEMVFKVSSAAMYGGGGRVIGVVLVLQDMTESVELTRQLNYQASHDTLTGLVNRREFERRLSKAIVHAQCQQEEHVLFYIDLDQFKVVNDTCGHSAGDELLKQLAVQLQGAMRESDTLARLGGDEFAVLLYDCPLDVAHKLAEGLCQLVKGFRFVWDEKSFEIGASIGMVPINHATEGMAQLLSAADAACYFAKDQGRNRVYTYHDGDDATQKRHGEMSWVHRITEAFEQSRFTLYAQHIAPLCGEHKGMHFEVLLRMVSEEGELVPPMAFIPAAERYNLMPTIDRWVIRTTFAKLCNARESRGDQPLTCAINISGQSLADEHFLEFILAQLEQSRIAAETICFEITETAAITNMVHAMKLLGELRQRGCRFSLDDFGSGISSFGYLKSLPVDYLKIDGSFVRDILDDRVDDVMVEAIHSVGEVMSLKTIAEFVEDEATVERLRQIGVNYVQGYAIAVPERLETILQREAIA